MLFHSFVTLALAGTAAVNAVPFAPRSVTSILLMDSPGYQGDSTNTLVVFEYFAYFPSTNLANALRKGLEVIFGKQSLDHDKLDIAVKRMELFGVLGRPEDKVDASISGCSEKSVHLARTGLKDLGIGSASISVGTCEGTGKLTGTAGNSPPAMIFRSQPKGFGVISDIDDTIKITDVLDMKLMAENTLYNDPLPVPGMPDIYKYLSENLISDSIPPQFLYVSGSPLQLYPFLKSFLEKTYTASVGPIFLQDFSITDLSTILHTISKGDIETYKETQIKKIHGWYPQKSFLGVGDSTQKDPEVYGES